MSLCMCSNNTDIIIGHDLSLVSNSQIFLVSGDNCSDSIVQQLLQLWCINSTSIIIYYIYTVRNRVLLNTP